MASGLPRALIVNRPFMDTKSDGEIELTCNFSFQYSLSFCLVRSQYLVGKSIMLCMHNSMVFGRRVFILHHDIIEKSLFNHAFNRELARKFTLRLTGVFTERIFRKMFHQICEKRVKKV